jgi:ribokinase
LTPNEHEATLLAGQSGQTIEQAARSLLAMGVGAVVATLGAQGAMIMTSSSKQVVAGFRVKAVDTTAAGDAFTAALACALARGDEMATAVRFANAVGALTVTKIGAQPSLPTAAEVQAFMQNR